MDTKRQFALGIFFLTSLSILAFYTLFLTDFQLFSSPTVLRVYFPGANGLRVGDPVMLSGLRVGRVKDLQYEVNAPPEERIRAVLNLSDPIELLAGTRITIEESTLLGGRQVNIYPGEFGGPPLESPEDGVYYGQLEENPIEALGAFGDLLSENRPAVKRIVDDLEALVGEAREGRGILGRLVYDETMGGDLAASVANLRSFTDDVRSGRGLLGRLIHDEELAASVRSTADDLSAVAADLRAGNGTLGRLLSDEEMAERVAQAIDDFAELGARIERGDGVAGKLLADEELAQRVDRAIENFASASSDLREVAARLRRGEGTLGRLFMDQELYDEALASVRLVTRTLEDYREAAPITSFTSVLFGAF